MRLLSFDRNVLKFNILECPLNAPKLSRFNNHLLHVLYLNCLVVYFGSRRYYVVERL